MPLHTRLNLPCDAHLVFADTTVGFGGDFGGQDRNWAAIWANGGQWLLNEASGIIIFGARSQI